MYIVYDSTDKVVHMTEDDVEAMYVADTLTDKYNNDSYIVDKESGVVVYKRTSKKVK